MDVNRLLNNSKKLLIEVYFELQEYYENIYPNALVVIEVGSFFEIYGTEKIGRSKEIAELLNIQLTRKNKSISKIDVKNPSLAGFPNHAIDRYLSKIIDEEKYTIILIKQKGTPPNIKRYLSDIISPGVNFEHSKKIENYTTSIIIEKIKDVYHIGYASIDIRTGKSYIYEAYSSKEDKTFALDELFRVLQSYKSAEIIFSLDKNVESEEIIKYLELSAKNIVYNSNRLKINYQNELFKRVYEIKSLLSPIEIMNLEHSSLSSESLAILLEFIINHNRELLKKIQKPIVLESDKFLYLGNNPIKQLNMQEVLKLIDFTKTPMGKRLLKERLFNPIKDKIKLENRYKMVEFMDGKEEFFSSELSNIYDLERLERKIKLQKLHPFEVTYLYESLKTIRNIYNFLKNETLELDDFIKDIENSFNLEESNKIMLSDIKKSIFKKRYNKSLDTLNDELEYYKNILKDITDKLELLFTSAVQIDIKELDKEGHYITLTKNRFYLIKEKFMESYIDYENKRIYFKDFHITTLKNSVKIRGEFIENISNKILSVRVKLISLTKELFLAKLEEYSNNYSLVKFNDKISTIDVAFSSFISSKKFNYVKPKINEKKPLFIKDLRHPIIENNQENGIFVPNTLNFEEYDGMLLYGINSSGKSSLMKATGIAIMLAQSGFFVPASKMEFSLYSGIFTRIESQDNLSKGLSTFAVEMMELKNIFNRADKNSLILGDEISHGTETLSALSIVASSIIKLSKLKSNFIFATHLHQLVHLDEIQSLKNVVSKHLEVYFDEKLEKLVYNRKLQDGNGSSVYGLEFAKSIYMDKEFLKEADSIRKRLSNDYDEIELLTQRKKSKYNKNLLITTCVICGKVAEDSHHIIEQSKSEGEFIENFHKNHKYNLIPLCKKHHKLVHDGRIIITGFITTENGIELHYENRD